MENRIETVKRVSIDFDIFKARLKECMKKKGYKKADLARITAITPATIGNYVNGERKPRGLEEIATIAKALDTSLDYLIGISDTEKPASPDPALNNYEDAYRMIMQIITRFNSHSQYYVTTVGDPYAEDEPYDALEIRIMDETLVEFFKKATRIAELTDMISSERIALLLRDLFEEMSKVPLPEQDKLPWEE